MTSLAAEWRRHDAIVIGHPATKGLIRFYVELGARRDHPRGHGKWETPHGHPTPRRQWNGQVEFDHPHLPACTTLEPLGERPGQGGESDGPRWRLAASNRRALRYSRDGFRYGLVG
jgi:hypothetical protein